MATADLYRGWVRLRDRAFSAFVRSSFHSFGGGSVIQLPVRLGGERRISVGQGVFVAADSWLQVLDGSDSEGPVITIGDRCSFAGHCVVTAVSSVRFGDAVLLARNVYISDHSHAFQDPTLPVLDQGVDRIAPVTIGSGAWLGQNVVVCPGVTIGRGAVIGANSVVRDDVPPHAVAVGAPARLVRQAPPMTQVAG